MDRVNKIIQHEKFIEYVDKIQNLEKTRIYCRHEMSHFVDVARIAYILSLEENSNISKEILYATALLHDIGRWVEYESGTDHALASKELALEILQDCAFSEKEITAIRDAIGHHRIKENHSTSLSQYLYNADKLSRPCISCKSITTCKRFADGEVAVVEY